MDVTNTGKVAGKTVVQIYVHDHASSLPRPYKELKGFAKVALEPGQTKTVPITLDPRAFAYYDPAFGQWVIESGQFEISGRTVIRRYAVTRGRLRAVGADAHPPPAPFQHDAANGSTIRAARRWSAR